MRSPLPHQHPNAFTLIEILVVVAIIGILAAILVPIASSARMRAADAGCIANLRSIAVGFQGYAADNDGRLPAVAAQEGGRWVMWNKDGIGPYVTGLSNAVQIGQATVFTCPASKNQKSQPGITGKGYGMNESLPGDADPSNWAFRDRSSRKMPIRSDQQSKTCLVIDSGHEVVGATWRDRVRVGASRHRESVNVLFLDSHVAAMNLDAIPFTGQTAPQGDLTANQFWNALSQ